MELSDGREAGLQHLHVGECGDGFDILRRELRQEPVHQFAPRPKAVVGRPAAFAETSHGALKRVAVHVDHARNGDTRVINGAITLRIS